MLTDEEIRMKSIELSIGYTDNLLNAAITSGRSIRTECHMIFRDAEMIFDYIRHGVIPE